MVGEFCSGSRNTVSSEMGINADVAVRLLFVFTLMVAAVLVAVVDTSLLSKESGAAGGGIERLSISAWSMLS